MAAKVSRTAMNVAGKALGRLREGCREPAKQKRLAPPPLLLVPILSKTLKCVLRTDSLGGNEI